MAALKKKLALSATSALVLLGIVEVGLRCAGYDPFGRMISVGRPESSELLAKDFLRESDAEDLVYELAPNAHTYAFGADVETNSFGFRDREYARDKPADAVRVVALGDSATFGVKLPAEAVWPERLEAGVALEGGRSFEVLNLGVVGYDILEQVAFFERVGRGFAPDLVIIGLHVNDLGYASPTRDYIRRVATYGSPWYRIRLLQFVRSRLDTISIAERQRELATEEYFVRENADRIADLAGDPDQLARIDALARRLEEAELSGEHRYVAWFSSPARVGKLRYSLERLGSIAEADGFRVAVFIVPWLRDAGQEAIYDAAYEIARAEVERVGFDYVPVVAQTRAAGHASLRIDARDFGHPNAAGHAILADTLAASFEERGWPGD